MFISLSKLTARCNCGVDILTAGLCESLIRLFEFVRSGQVGPLFTHPLLEQKRCARSVARVRSPYPVEETCIVCRCMKKMLPSRHFNHLFKVNWCQHVPIVFDTECGLANVWLSEFRARARWALALPGRRPYGL